MNTVVETFEWKPAGSDRPGIPLHEMSTTHLYNVLRMIWNHTAPEELKLQPYRQYKFGAFYTVEYMQTAVRLMLAELDNRTGLSTRSAKEVRYMTEVLKIEDKPKA